MEYEWLYQSSGLIDPSNSGQSNRSMAMAAMEYEIALSMSRRSRQSNRSMAMPAMEYEIALSMSRRGG